MSETRYTRHINLNETPPVLRTPNGASNHLPSEGKMATSNSTSSPFNSQSTYVYFIAAGSTPIKIGVSNDPAARLRDLQTAHYQKLHLLYTIECADRAKAFELESAFHRWYGDVHIRNEWFSLTPKKIVEDVRLLATLAGSVVSTLQFASPEQIEKMEVRAVRREYRRTTDARASVRKHLTENPTDIHLSSRALAAKLNGQAGKSVIAEVLTEMRAERFSQQAVDVRETATDATLRAIDEPVFSLNGHTQQEAN